MLYRFKMAAINNRFLFHVISILAKNVDKKQTKETNKHSLTNKQKTIKQNLNKHFPKGIFQWNLAQSRRTWIDLHYWNSI